MCCDVGTAMSVAVNWTWTDKIFNSHDSKRLPFFYNVWNSLGFTHNRAMVITQPICWNGVHTYQLQLIKLGHRRLTLQTSNLKRIGEWCNWKALEWSWPILSDSRSKVHEHKILVQSQFKTAVGQSLQINYYSETKYLNLSLESLATLVKQEVEHDLHLSTIEVVFSSSVLILNAVQKHWEISFMNTSTKNV